MTRSHRPLPRVDGKVPTLTLPIARHEQNPQASLPRLTGAGHGRGRRPEGRHRRPPGRHAIVLHQRRPRPLRCHHEPPAGTCSAACESLPLKPAHAMEAGEHRVIIRHEVERCVPDVNDRDRRVDEGELLGCCDSHDDIGTGRTDAAGHLLPPSEARGKPVGVEVFLPPSAVQGPGSGTVNDAKAEIAHPHRHRVRNLRQSGPHRRHHARPAAGVVEVPRRHERDAHKHPSPWLARCQAYVLAGSRLTNNPAWWARRNRCPSRPISHAGRQHALTYLTCYRRASEQDHTPARVQRGPDR